MSVAPEDFLAEAEKLASRDDEMGVRLTVNRAYYGAFHMAEAVAPLVPGYRPSDRNQPSHQELLDWFATAKGNPYPGAQQAKQIHMALSQSRKLRRIADYVLSASLAPQQARAALNNAKEVRRLIPEFVKRRPPAD